jgi:hypothetical protein
MFLALPLPLSKWKDLSGCGKKTRGAASPKKPQSNREACCAHHFSGFGRKKKPLKLEIVFCVVEGLRVAGLAKGL